jgi:hypothetical protein
VDIVSTLSNVVRGSDEVNVIARALAIFVEDKKSFEILRWCVNDNLDSSGTRLLLLAPTHFSFSNGSIFSGPLFSPAAVLSSALGEHLYSHAINNN